MSPRRPPNYASCSAQMRMSQGWTGLSLQSEARSDVSYSLAQAYQRPQASARFVEPVASGRASPAAPRSFGVAHG